MQRLLSILNPGCETHTGVSLVSSGARFVAVARRKGAGARTIAVGAGSSPIFRLMRPLCAHMDLDFAPVIFVSQPLDGTDADSWVTQNESRIIPPGLSSAQVVNEYGVEDGEVFSATVSKPVLEKSLKKLNLRGVIPGSVSPPLWDLARLYGLSPRKDFVLWKIGTDQSVLGFVAGGKLRMLCAFWAGRNDLAGGPDACVADLVPLLKSLTGATAGVDVIAYDADNGVSAEAQCLDLQGFRIAAPPRIPGIPVTHHEAYALALHEETFVDFAPPEAARAARGTVTARCSALRFAVATAVVAVALSVFAAISGAVISYAKHRVDTRARPVAALLVDLKSRQATRDSLLGIYNQRARFLSRESAVTALLSDLQSAFPEGSWVEDMSITESDGESWRVDLNGIAISTGIIPALLKDLGDSAGIADARMVYSEQGTAVVKGRKDKVVRMKINGSWRPRQ